jgi:HEAT repeat protein
MNHPHTSHGAARSIALLTLMAMSISGCAQDQVASDSQQEAWSTKSDSAMLSEMPPRPEVFVGEQIPVVVNEQDLRSAAVEILNRAVDSTNPLLRVNAIQAFEYAPDLAPDAIRKGLGDANRGVRFVSTMLVGRLRLTDLAPLVEPLLLDESESVHAAAIYALRRCGSKPNMNPLSRMVQGEDPEVRANAALVLGELGDTSALSLLRHALGRGMFKASSARRRIVELQIAEAMVKLGDMQQLEVIRAALFSRPEEGELTALACQIIGEVKDEGSLPNLLDLATRGGRQQQSAEIRMAAVMAASEINRDHAVLAVPLAYAGSTRFELRAQAASTLGASRQTAALPHLTALMQDANPLVQVTAAGGVLRIQGDNAPDGGFR